MLELQRGLAAHYDFRFWLQSSGPPAVGPWVPSGEQPPRVSM